MHEARYLDRSINDRITRASGGTGCDAFSDDPAGVLARELPTR